MKVLQIVFASLVLVLAPIQLHAQNPPYSANIVGYVNTPFLPGATFFANPLEYTNNHLSFLIPTAPEGASLQLWNPTLQQYNPAITFSGGEWSANPLLPPGLGALMLTPTVFTNTFVGTVLDANGGIYDGNTLHLPSPFAGPNGLYLVSSIFPAAGTNFFGFNFFDVMFGRGPNENEAFYRWNGSEFIGTTFYGGVWDNGNPFLNVGESGFFDIGGTGMLPPVPDLTLVPEPGTSAFLALAVFLFGIAKRSRRI